MVRINDNKNQEVKIAEAAGQLLQQVNLDREIVIGNFGCTGLIAAAGVVLLLLGSVYGSSKTLDYIGGALLGFGFLLLIGTCGCDYLGRRHENQLRILQTARDRLFQPVREAKADNYNNLPISLVSTEEQAKYKEENEEPNLRLDSPRRAGCK